MPSLEHELIARAELFPGIRAGIARPEDILNAPSYQVTTNGDQPEDLPDKGSVTEWSSKAGSVLVMGLHHPEDNPRLDWWDGNNSPGNRQLIAISDSLKVWLEEKQGIGAIPLSYYVERGGLFLKDAAVLAGLGIVGRNNLLLNPEWGARIRLRAVLIRRECEPSQPMDGFSPCDTCDNLCHNTCPQNAFSTGVYCRTDCMRQMDADIANRIPDGEDNEDGIPMEMIKYCRACEFICPVGEPG